MKRIFLTLLALAFLLSACVNKNSDQESAFKDDSRLKVVVSIPPLEWLVNQLGGDKVQVVSLTVSGDDPHTYEPTPAQMTAVSQADLYLAVGVEFEEAWLPRFQAGNQKLTVVDIARDIDRIPVAETVSVEEDPHAAEHDEHDHEGLDPHVWLSTDGMKNLAYYAAKALREADPKNSDFYDANLEKTFQIIGAVGEKLNALLFQTARKQFLIIHPSMGYLANEFGLEMLPVEVDGQEPTPAQLAALLKATEAYGIHTLFVQKGNNLASANTLASQAGITSIYEFDPLEYDWEANMLSVGQALAEALN